MDPFSIIMALLFSAGLATAPCDASKGESAVCINAPAEEAGKQTQVRTNFQGTKQERNNISNGF